MENGHCVVCGVVGRGRSNFICETCGDPNRVIVFCSGCRTHFEGTEHLIGIIERAAGMSIPRRNGVSIRVSGCASCAASNASISTEMFLLRRRAH
jgi:hypothetical protein